MYCSNVCRFKSCSTHRPLSPSQFHGLLWALPWHAQVAMHSCTSAPSHTLLCYVKCKACAAVAYNKYVCTGSQSIVLKTLSTLWPSVRKSGQKADLLQLISSESLQIICLPNSRGTAHDSALSSACRMCSNRIFCSLFELWRFRNFCLADMQHPANWKIRYSMLQLFALN